MGKRQLSTQVGYFEPTKMRKRSRAMKGKKRNALVAVPRNKLGFPQQIKTTLRYAMRTEFALTNDQTFVCKLRANDLRDPEVALGGHQPRGFDDFMNIYDKFTVTGSKISASFMYEGYTGPSVKGLLNNLIQNTAPLHNAHSARRPPRSTRASHFVGAGRAQCAHPSDRVHSSLLWLRGVPLPRARVAMRGRKCSRS